ncbi:hypothetical protein [Lihuaxuella thermophila]|uniref:Uncharacterized protein n=1 Tax=Lihuaxuella thermophila TaxID=1173111 RepID=A0A1H8E312_9BACL|nr:hypothetical protein [Lihuaxuella thermophila]SEN13825.1 hypothetical protein SAMN05444955_106105 [Lihuaxuella thermophila]
MEKWLATILTIIVALALATGCGGGGGDGKTRGHSESLPTTGVQYGVV